jgi:hypothetical protein
MAKRGMASKSLMSFENLLGFLLAFLIVFDLKMESSISNMINSPVGLVLSLVVLVVIFVVMNPIVGLLFLIYLYETVKHSSSMLYEYTQPVEKVRKNIMNRLNLGNDNKKDEVEIEIVNKMAPIVRKSERLGVDFKPMVLNEGNLTHV